MPALKYPVEVDAKKAGKVTARNLRVSMKWSIELAREIRGMPLADARGRLNDIIAMRRPLQLKRFNWHVAHKSGGWGSGRFPLKAAQTMLDVLDSAASNAEAKGLEAERLRVIHVSASEGGHFFRPRLRWKPHRAKATNIWMVVGEVERAEKAEKVETTKKAGRAERAEIAEKAEKKVDKRALEAAKKVAKADAKAVAKATATKAEEKAPTKAPAKEATIERKTEAAAAKETVTK